MKKTFSFLLLCFFTVISVQAQETTSIYGANAVMTEPAKPSGMRGVSTDLPDISVIGDIAGKLTNRDGDADRDKINLRGVELAFQGYIYPQMRANVIIGIHKHGSVMETEVEEAYADILKLYGNFSAKAGKYLAGLGKLNGQHQHHWPFVDQPQVNANFLGGHGLSTEGAMLKYLLPLPFFAQVEASWGNAPEAHHHSDEQTATVTDINGNQIEVAVHTHDETAFSLASETRSGRLWMSFPLGTKSELETGFSGASAQGAHYKEHKDDVQLYTCDLTLKLWPTSFSRFVFQNELMQMTRTVPLGELKRFGAYSYVGYKFNQYWSSGLRFDYAEDAFPHNGDINVADITKAGSFILTKNLTETTYLRGQYKYYAEPQGIFEVYAQLCFGIGPHSHPLE